MQKRSIVIPGVIVAKLKSVDQIPDIANALSSLAYSVPILNIKKVFPFHKNSVELSRIVQIGFPVTLPPEEMATVLSQQDMFDYVEPRYLSFVETIIPNDSLLSQQIHFAQTNMFAAWGIQQGSAETIIAIIDNGTDYHHPDLITNIWTNQIEAEGLPGIDDDGNGYVDDIHGWDFGENDNDPTHGIDESPVTVHGTHTAGIAAAVTNNHIGVAGISWNCTLMPVKVSTDENTYEVPFGYEGIVYAADNGAHIISNSWGREGPFSQFEQDIINYAVDKSCVVLAAAGNTNSETTYYPGGYVHVIAIAAVNDLDQKASYSSYGKFVDVSAPGGDKRSGRPGILSTYPVERGSYGELSGTSMATPIVAGIMGLLINRFPEFRLQQLTRQIILTADHIDDLNTEYQELLGFGRVNGVRALAQEIIQTEEPAKIALFQISVSDSIWGNGNFLFERNETIGVDVWYRNYAISPGRNLVLTLNSEDNDLALTKKQATVDYVPPDSIFAIRQQLNFTIKPHAQPHLAKLILNYSLDNGNGGNDTLFSIIGKSAILLVDDDNGIRNVEGYYTTALDQLNTSYLRWDHAVLGTPPAETLLHFPTIIWFCEWAFPSLTSEDRMALRYYLNQGGNVFISGQDIGWDLADPTGAGNNEYSELAVQFYWNCLHSIYRADDSGSDMVIGIPGTIGQGMKFHIYQPQLPPQFQFPEWIEPTPDARLAFQYDNDKGAGVSFIGDYRILYSGFGLEAVDAKQEEDPNRLSNDRIELMQRVLDELGPLCHEPISDQEQNVDSVVVKVKLSPFVNDLQTLSIFWKLDNMPDFSELPMIDVGEHGFKQTLHLKSYLGKVQYFFKLSSPYYGHYLPIPGQKAVYTFFIGQDRQPPKIYHVPLYDIFVQNQNRNVMVFIKDNVAVDQKSVWLHYQTAGKTDSVVVTTLGNQWYQSSIPAIIDFGDSISYYFSARDLATIPNRATSPLFSYRVGFEGFEYGLNFWKADTNSWGLDDQDAHSGRYCISSNPGGTFKNNLNINLQSRLGIRRRILKDMVLSFWTKYELGKNKDFGFVEISLNNGQTWMVSGSPITGIRGYWSQFFYDLTDFYIETDDSLLLRWRLQTDSTQTQPMKGWFVDDISIQSKSALGVFERVLINRANRPIVEIYPNSPNPFNDVTKIPYYLSSSAEVTFEVYNLLGQIVIKQILGFQQAGYHDVLWDAKNVFKQSTRSGIYFGRLCMKNTDSNSDEIISKTVKMVYLE